MGYLEDLALLEKYGIKTAKSLRVKSTRDWDKVIEELGFPFVAKIEAKEPIHKTEFGGVKVVENEMDLEDFLRNVEKIKNKVRISGVIVQEMLSGVEVFIGGKRDPQFGPVVLFGLGGLFVEIMEDVSIRLAPLSKKDAEQMIKEIKGYTILAGARGRKPVKMGDLVSALIGVSRLMVEHEDIREIDINPLFANEKYVKAADVRVIR